MALQIDKAAIKRSIDLANSQIPDIEREITRANAAGIDVSDAKARLAALKEQVNKLNTYYNS